jgi:lysophospholipase L1-like esterase
VRTLLRFLIVLFAVVAAASGLACNSSDDATGALLPEDVSGGVYVALGDSVAAGSGASDPETTSYVALVGAALRDRYGETLEVRNLADGGATTQSLIDGQLDAATEALREGDVRLVTITIGGNDLNELQSSPDTPACLADVRSPACPVAELLVGTEERLDTILGELRAAGPETAIVMELYPNLFSGTGHIFEGPADDAFAMLNEVIARVTERYDIVLADPRAPFVGGGRELTRLLDATPDAHPNDAGHRAIAEAFLEAVGLQD